MRADATRNRERLLDTAVDVILEAGGEPARDALAKRAGVGIGTLYRHFPDQQALLRAVALHVLDRTIADGEVLLATATNGGDTLREYMHRAVDNGLGALNLIYPLLDDVNWPERRARADALLNGIVDRAKRDGLMRPDATVQDVGFAIIRACRPLAVGLPPDDERTLAHRHIDIYVDGLLADCASADPAMCGTDARGRLSSGRSWVQGETSPTAVATPTPRKVGKEGSDG